MSTGVAPPGDGLRRASWFGAAAQTVATAPAVADPDGLGVLCAAVSLVLFAGGIVTMLLAFARAVERSRRDAIGMGGLYLLADSAPPAVARSFRIPLVLQTVVGLGGAIARPYTPLAFGILAPVWALGLAGMWGARHGTFESRTGAGS